MKKLVFLSIITLILATMAAAQANTTPAPSQTPANNQSQAPATTPGQAPAATAAPAAGGGNSKGAPQPKTQEEYKAYQEVAAKTDATQLDQAADQFAQKYPNSDLRVVLYKAAMNMYRAAGQTDRAIAAGRKSLAIDPTDPVPNVIVAFSLAQSTHDTDLDRNDRFNEANTDAQRAIDNIDTGMAIPPNTPAEKVQAAKNGILEMAYETQGTIAMTKKDYPAAETAFRKGLDVNKNDPDGVLYLRLAIALDNDKKYPDALDATDKALKYSQPGSEAVDLANKEKARLQKLVGTTPQIPAAAPNPQ